MVQRLGMASEQLPSCGTLDPDVGREPLFHGLAVAMGRTSSARFLCRRAVRCQLYALWPTGGILILARGLLGRPCGRSGWTDRSGWYRG